MDEQEWLTSKNPERMYPVTGFKGVNERQSRLIACACARLVSHLCANPVAHRAIEVAERFADGLGTTEDLRQAEQACFEVARLEDFQDRMGQPGLAAEATAEGTVLRFPVMAARRAMEMSILAAAPWKFDVEGGTFHTGERHLREAHHAAVADLLREIVGNPFRPVRLDPDWLAWNHGVVGQLAETIYAEQRWRELPVLADALEDAGCDVPEILAHCRGPGPHVRGCWALDLARGLEPASVSS